MASYILDVLKALLYSSFLLGSFWIALRYHEAVNTKLKVASLLAKITFISLLLLPHFFNLFDDYRRQYFLEVGTAFLLSMLLIGLMFGYLELLRQKE